MDAVHNDTPSLQEIAKQTRFENTVAFFEYSIILTLPFGPYNLFDLTRINDPIVSNEKSTDQGFILKKNKNDT
jgi:hypothetical protein